MERLCNVCKGKLNEAGFGKYKCPWCGNEYREQDFLTDEANIIADIDTYSLLKKARDSIELDYDFSKSLKFSQNVLERDPFSQEANWLALLAENQIIYLQNDSGEYVPSFLQPEKSSVKRCKYYSALNSQFKADAEKVEKVRLEAVAEYERIKPYDVFISYRQHELDGAETKEAVWARDIYTELKTNPKTKHLNVFFDQKCLTGSNAGWEPHIYSAVHSAKCMIILGSSLKNINSRWVRNEWKRFLAFKSRGEKKDYIVLADESVNPLLLDEELQGKQVISNTSGKWLNDIGNRVVEVCCPKIQKTEKEPKESLHSKPKKERKKMSKAAKVIVSCVLAAIIFVTGGFFYWSYREEKSKQYTLHLNYGEAYGELTTVELTYDDLIPKLPGGLSISSKGYMDFVGWFTGKDCTGAQLTDAEGDSVLHLNDDLTAYSSEKHIIMLRGF